LNRVARNGRIVTLASVCGFVENKSILEEGVGKPKLLTERPEDDWPGPIVYLKNALYLSLEMDVNAAWAYPPGELVAVRLMYGDPMTLILALNVTFRTIVSPTVYVPEIAEVEIDLM